MLRFPLRLHCQPRDFIKCLSSTWWRIVKPVSDRLPRQATFNQQQSKNNFSDTLSNPLCGLIIGIIVTVVVQRNGSGRRKAESHQNRGIERFPFFMEDFFIFQDKVVRNKTHSAGIWWFLSLVLRLIPHEFIHIYVDHHHYGWRADSNCIAGDLHGNGMQRRNIDNKGWRCPIAL